MPKYSVQYPSEYLMSEETEPVVEPSVAIEQEKTRRAMIEAVTTVVLVVVYLLFTLLRTPSEKVVPIES